MKKVLIFLGVSLLLSTSEVHATTFGVELIEAQLLNSQGASIATISGTVTGTYKDATGIVTMDAGTTVFSWFVTPITSLYSDSHTDWETGAGSYSAAAYECIEGSFGASVCAHLCGNYRFDPLFLSCTDDSSVDYSTIPGTRTIGGDDEAVGDQLQGDDWATSTVSFVPGSLIMQTADWNPGGGPPTGRQLTFTVEIIPNEGCTECPLETPCCCLHPIIGDSYCTHEGQDVECQLNQGGTWGGCRGTAICGNGNVEFPEQCDDNNTTNGDGCSDICECENCSAEFDEVQIIDNGDGTYSYYFIRDGITVIEIINNNGPINLADFSFTTVGGIIVGTSISNLTLNGTTKSITLPDKPNLCAVDDTAFVSGLGTWNCLNDPPDRILWRQSLGNQCGEPLNPVAAKDALGVDLPQYTCEKVEIPPLSGTYYAKMSGFTHTTVVGVDDTGEAAIPTLSEWGMIIFMSIILGIGVVMLYRRREI